MLTTMLISALTCLALELLPIKEYLERQVPKVEVVAK